MKRYGWFRTMLANALVWALRPRTVGCANVKKAWLATGSVTANEFRAAIERDEREHGAIHN